MKSQNPQGEKAGFEYYLQQVQRGREAARREIPIGLLRLLEGEGGKLPLVRLARLYLPPDASMDEINSFLLTIRQLKAAGLVLVEGDEGPPETVIANARVELTEAGVKLVASGLTSSY